MFDLDLAAAALPTVCLSQALPAAGVHTGAVTRGLVVASSVGASLRW